MIFRPTRIPGVILIEPQVFEDERGFFMESYQRERFLQAGIEANFVQDNHNKKLNYYRLKPIGRMAADKPSPERLCT